MSGEAPERRTDGTLEPRTDATPAPRTNKTPERQTDATPAPATERRDVIKWLWRAPVIALLAGGAYGAYRAIDVHFVKRRPDPTPEFTAAGPETVAPLESFQETWEAVDFMLDSAPGVAVRVPEPVTGGLDADGIHLVAFSRICTHQQCLVSFNSDVSAIRFGFNYDASSPAITCPCHLSVFDPVRAGQAVSGPAVLPLPRARLELRNRQVVATGWERPRA